MIERTSVAVVGAGVTGLALGHYLAAARVSHIVFEAAGRPGGVIRSARVEGHLLEWGPQRTRLTAGIRDLVRELGLAEAIVTAPPGLPLLVYRAGKLRRVPFSAAAFARSNIVPFRAKLRVLLEPFTAGPRMRESVADFFIRKLGRDVYENMVGPLYGGLYASDPADMVVGLSLAHVLTEFGIGRSLLVPLLRRGGGIDPPPAISFVDGMESLPRALHASNAGNVRFGAPVYGLHRVGSRWNVEWAGGTAVVDRVVVTTPAAAAANLLSSETPISAIALRRLRYNPLAVVHLYAETSLSGLGYQVSLAERLATRGVTFNDSLFGRTGVYTAYLGGSRAPEVVEWDDEEIGAVAAREFRSVTGFEARPLSVAREAMPAWDASWEALASVLLPAGVHLAANWESRPGIPGRLAQAKRLAAVLAREFGVSGGLEPPA